MDDTNSLQHGAADAALPVRDPNLGFLTLWIITLLAVVAVVGAINAVVDPFLVTGAPRIKGFNAKKPEIETHGQLGKDYLVARVKPQGVYLGSSKVDLGLDPASPNWPADARPAFNYGVPGNDLRQMDVNLRRALAVGPVRRALVLVDIEDIMAAKPAAPEAPLTRTPWQSLEDWTLALLSTDSLRGSIATVAGQRSKDISDSSPLGQMSDTRYRSRSRDLGADSIFIEKDFGLNQALADMKTGLKAQPQAGYAGLDDLADIIRVARDKGVALDIVIAPFHADYLEMLRQNGLWDRYKGAKGALTQLVADQGGGQARLWDFLGFDAYSTEAVPQGKGAETQWFWEPSHFKGPLGEKILAVIYHGDTGYGVQLTPQTLAPRLAADDQAAQAYEPTDAAFKDRMARAQRQ